MYTFFLFLLLVLLLYVFRERVEMFTVFQKGSDMRNSLNRYYDDTAVVLKGIVDINNSVASVVVQRAGVLFLDMVWFDESTDILDHAQVSESMNDFMTFDDYDILFDNVKKHFEGRVVVGVIRLVTEGSVTVIVYDESNDKNRVYDVTFDKDTLIVLSDMFLNIEFNKPVVELVEKPEYVYDFNQFVLLLKNMHTYFARDSRKPHGTIRLTKDILTVIVMDPNTYASIVYDVHYNHETMAIRNVVRSDMTFVLESTSDMHRLIKKSALL